MAQIVDVTLADTTFIRQFHDIVGRLDTVVDVTNRLLKRNAPVLNAAMGDLRIVSADLKALLDRNSPGLDSIVADGQILMAKGIALLEQADSLVADVKAVLKNVEDGKGTLGKLYADDSFYDELKAVMASVDTLVSEVQQDALRLRVRLGFGKKKSR